MSKQTVFNRRIGSDEYEVWAALPCDSSIEYLPEEATDWITGVGSLPDSIAYIATVDDEPVGGTLLHRDLRRKGIALIALRVTESVRKQMLTLLCRTSLPYFGTPQIKAVDVIISQDDASMLPFPPGLELPSWTESAITELGFLKRLSLSALTLRWSHSEPPIPVSIPWDTAPSLDGADRLVMRERQRTLLHCNHIRFSIELASMRGALHTLSRGGRTMVCCCGPMLWGSQAIVPFVVASRSSDIGYDTIVRWLFNETRAAGIDTLSLLLCGQGQTELIKALEMTSPSTIVKRDLHLFRRTMR